MSDSPAVPPIRYPEPDPDAVLRVIQDQLDELLTADESQRAEIGELRTRVKRLEDGGRKPPGGP